jgi:hypothetical protein
MFWESIEQGEGKTILIVDQIRSLFILFNQTSDVKPSNGKLRVFLPCSMEDLDLLLSERMSRVPMRNWSTCSTRRTAGSNPATSLLKSIPGAGWMHYLLWAWRRQHLRPLLFNLINFSKPLPSELPRRSSFHSGNE